MEGKDFGQIAFVVNEFGGLEHGEVQVYADGRLVIQYSQMCQTIAPHDLNNMLVVKRNEYEEELEPLVKARDEADGPSWRERNLRSYIGYLKDISYKINELQSFQVAQKIGEDGE